MSRQSRECGKTQERSYDERESVAARGVGAVRLVGQPDQGVGVSTSLSESVATDHSASHPAYPQREQVVAEIQNGREGRGVECIFGATRMNADSDQPHDLIAQLFRRHYTG